MASSCGGSPEGGLFFTIYQEQKCLMLDISLFTIPPPPAETSKSLSGFFVYRGRIFIKFL
ncbi:hypothetical protein A2331_03195 [Candidatus Falkowbacteria bacterium RIFOXYB2_FULL_34_18]|uniref:Uncharacterized protein n=1 Tax=Candidatus Falkowbacteria bacterium RIFOXYD2_FULL_34_120 TaxID=1798007 RepID=A0A1F5TMS5_9BACT|nr:MAG: hypothetical protein A2500_02570 [Candidatus Falkowbacteria bacterium RIFOXYC12_FULL_34_55]OGF28584.1 MAG: hypothetical protein A2331_03195 [Candidatus Falkowbacteria bacterium RIFOXYB2_FULL_34_18]OGF38025.1 MAG: hypothetical protein A2466_06910 [Candidatus Falkowbacteria bacterium RIFOXYC2_FULL_34_220]OGF38274.1 MAG: hypothetical protein A2515_04945 [Candidatus Falkowbacteria bacterium RIFOXYD12_FULL_34_57]OGF40186.1 MAG: hypothetical protein A2531_01140 [Candidatus Falkowbacteria bact